MVVGVEELSLGGGDFVLVPRGTLHTFANTSDVDARLLVIHAPAMDGYVAGLHELWHRDAPLPSDDERALMARFGMEHPE